MVELVYRDQDRFAELDLEISFCRRFENHCHRESWTPECRGCREVQPFLEHI